MNIEQDHKTIINALQSGELALQGQFVLGSNYTFLVETSFENNKLMAVYKPSRGERPLWDFPTRSLAKREAAAYLVSEALGWQLVPPTVYRRQKAPLGPGSLQLFVEHKPDFHYFTFTNDIKQRLRPAAVFDILVNNADRKGGHIIVDSEDHIWLIDHGLCFHHEDKLRTILWDFSGEPIADDLLSRIDALVAQLEEETAFYRALARLISPVEISALCRRGRSLITVRTFPLPSQEYRPYPWPPI